MNVLVPDGWIAATLSEVANWSSGGTPSRTNPNFFSGSIPWIKTGELGPQFLHGTEENISEDAVASSSAKVFPTGSVALAMYGATIGKASILAVDASTNQACAVGTPDAVSSLLLYYFLLSQREAFVDARKGGAQPNISQGIVKDWPILVPPVNEQTRIVEKLEELLSDLDAGVAELKAAQRKLAQYRQSLLKAAMEGALTEAWRKTRTLTPTPLPAGEGLKLETGVDLLQRILTERRARWETRQLAKFAEQGKTTPKDWKAKYPEPVSPDTTDLPALPEGWTWATIDQLSPDDLANGRSVPTADVGAKVLRLTAVKQGRIDLSEYKTGAWSSEEARPFAVCDGDLLIVRGNGSLSLVGRLGLVRGVSEQVAYPDTLIRLRLTESVVLPEWVMKNWDSRISRTHLERRARTSAGIYKISQPDIVSLPVPIPPMSEQTEILSLLEHGDEQLDSLDATLDAGLKQSAAQRKNILKAAFAGQLVPQDPNDEPASALLERIRAERGNLQHSSTRPRRTKPPKRPVEPDA